MSVYLSDLGIACSLGLGKASVARALFQERSCPIQSKWNLLSGKVVPVGKVPFELPELPTEWIKFNSRNNKLLKLALDEIKPSIEYAIGKYGPSRLGIIMATSTSGMHEEEQAFIHKHHTGEEPVAYHYAQSEISSPSLFASLYLGINGPAYTISTACSSSGKALCSARRLISTGFCDAVVVGGVDTLCALTLNGFDSLDLVSNAICSPFSKNRSGITIGEGAAVFLATREGMSTAIELSGCGESSDAYHISCPDPEGLGAEIAIKNALSMASKKPEAISYINLHGTGSLLNDTMESICINRIFGDKIPCSSTKALTGHTLGASGAIEAAFLWLALIQDDNGKIPLPRHAWDGEMDPSLPPIPLIGFGEYASPINGQYALMSNSFAFGGSNVSIILKKHVSLHSDVIDLVPHDPPMVLIDQAITCQDSFIHCQVSIRETSPFCCEGSVPSYIAMEYMAQTIAVWSGIRAKQENKNPSIGFLLGARRLELYVPGFKVGDVLDVYGKVQYMDGEMGSFDSWIDIKGKRVVNARMNVYQPKDPDAK